MRRAAFSSAFRVFSSPAAAARNSALSGMLFQMKYDSRLAASYGRHRGSEPFSVR